MKVSKRQQHIIELLLKRQEETTISEIAQEVGVSTRTVHRELSELEAVFEWYGLALMKKAGIGILLSGTEEALQKLKSDIIQQLPEEYTSEERRVLIICKLLESREPIKLYTFSVDLQVAMPTISSDLDELEELIQKNGLSLIRRRGYGVEVAGPEERKRKLIGYLAVHYLDDSYLFGGLTETAADPVVRQLLSMVGPDSFHMLEKALWHLEDRYPTMLTETAYTRLLVRLSIAITRFRNGFGIPASESTLQELDSDQEYKYECIKSQLPMPLPKEEAFYMVHLLKEWDGVNQEDIISREEHQLNGRIVELIARVEQELKVPLSEDASLREGLLHHIAPALKRLQNGEPIRNPLLSQIKKDYEALFAILKACVGDIAEDWDLPDTEIGYLVMHFGAALERSKQIIGKVRALLVCTSGIGSSKLLAVRIAKEVPQIELLGHVSWFEAARIPEHEYELIISTVDLPLRPEQYIKLSPLLTNDETERLRSFVKSRVNSKPNLQRAPDPSDSLDLKFLQNVKAYSQDIVKLIEQFKVHQMGGEVYGSYGTGTLRSIVNGICSVLAERHQILNTNAIAERLIQREKYGSQVIPNSGLALLHTRSEWVPHPVLLLFRYETPLHWESNSHNKQTVQQILLMLGPKEMEKETLEVLSEVSSMLLETEFIHRLELDGEESIKRYLLRKFEQFIKMKLEWRE